MEELAKEDRDVFYEEHGRTFKSGETVFREGDSGEHCFLVQSGRVRLAKRIRSVERNLLVLKSGDLFGEEALLERCERSASAIALTDTQVLALSAATFGQLIAGNAAVAQRLMQQLVSRLRDAEERLENVLLRDNPSRVVNTLMRLAGGVERSSEGHVVSASPLDLSSRVGLDVEAVKRVIQQLRDGGYVRIVDERIILPDLKALRELYDLLGLKEDVRGNDPA